ncbi:MAG: SHOCT domain-containing protein [Planctomycetes bacterium]|nr:SHOCT domain-containing protein [Planctomycetota bacterium]
MSDAEPEKLLPELQKELPAVLSRFAPRDPAAEAKVRARLRAMAPSALRTRRARIDRRLQQLGSEIGEVALEIPSVRGTGLRDIDRILRKISRLDDADEEHELERQVKKAEGGLLAQLAVNVDWLARVFTNREQRTRRQLLTAELGLALSACDHEVLAEYAPHVKAALDERIAHSRRIDELFVQARLVDEEFARRGAEGLGDEPPKDIDRLLAKAASTVDGVGDKLVDFGAHAASSAVKGGTIAAWELARGAAVGAWSLGKRRAGSDDAPELDDPLERPLPAPPPRRQPASAPRGQAPLGPGPDPAAIPQLIRDLAQLRLDGILTDEEYKRKKAELLRRL